MLQMNPIPETLKGQVRTGSKASQVGGMFGSMHQLTISNEGSRKEKGYSNETNGCNHDKKVIMR